MELSFKKRTLRASITVEASYVMCVVLFAMVTVIKVSYRLCEEVKMAAVCERTDYEPVKLLHATLLLEEMGDVSDED